MIFDDSANESRKRFKKYTELWDGLKNEIKTINGGKEGEYSKCFLRIKLDSTDDLLLNKSLKLRMLTIIVRSIFEEDGKLYLQVYLDEYLYELQEWK